jgi:molybdopterin-binding protein
MKMIENTRMHGTVKQIAAGRSCTTVQMELDGGGCIEAIATASQARRMRIKVGKEVSAVVLKDHKAHIAA